jgi:hypothetical protein
LRTTFLVLPLAALVTVACSETIAPIPSPHDAPLFSNGPAQPRVVPELIAGNIAGNASSICNNNLVNKSGTAWRGHKVEGSGNRTAEGVAVTISGRKYLAWNAAGGGTRVQAVVVKGGPDTHVYRYNPAFDEDGEDITADAQLRAPNNGGDNVPDISHYTVCVTDAPPPPVCVTAWAAGDRTLAMVLGQPTAPGWQISYNRPATLQRTLWAGTQNDSTVAGAFPVGRLSITPLGGTDLRFDFSIDAPWSLDRSYLYTSRQPVSSADPTTYPFWGADARYEINDYLAPSLHFFAGHVRVCRPR